MNVGDDEALAEGWLTYLAEDEIRQQLCAPAFPPSERTVHAQVRFTSVGSATTPAIPGTGAYPVPDTPSFSGERTSLPPLRAADQYFKLDLDAFGQ